MKKHYFIYLTIAAIYLMMAGCSKKQAEELKPEPPAEPTTTITYTNFVGTLLTNKCASCHGPGQPQASIFTLNGYSTVVANAARIRQAVIVNKTMPKVGSLTAAELQSLDEWLTKGTPE